MELYYGAKKEFMDVRINEFIITGDRGSTHLLVVGKVLGSNTGLTPRDNLIIFWLHGRNIEIFRIRKILEDLHNK